MELNRKNPKTEVLFPKPNRTEKCLNRDSSINYPLDPLENVR